MDIVCRVASPNIELVFIYISSHLLFVVAFRYANGWVFFPKKGGKKKKNQQFYLG